MSDYGNEQQNEIMRSMEAMPGVNFSWNPFEDWEPFGIAAGRYLLIGLFPILIVLFFVLAYLAEIHSYWNLLFLEASAGFVFFAATPRIVRLGRKYGWQVRLVGLVIAVPSLALAYYLEEVLPQLSDHNTEFFSAALIEYSCALLLMIGLEVTITPWLEALEKREAELRAARAKTEAYEKKLDAWRAALERGEMDTPYPEE